MKNREQTENKICNVKDGAEVKSNIALSVLKKILIYWSTFSREHQNHNAKNQKRGEGNSCSKQKKFPCRKAVVRKKIKVLRIAHWRKAGTEICRKSFEYNKLKTGASNLGKNQKSKRHKGKKGNIICNKHGRKKDQQSHQKIKGTLAFAKTQESGSNYIQKVLTLKSLDYNHKRKQNCQSAEIYSL